MKSPKFITVLWMILLVIRASAQTPEPLKPTEPLVRRAPEMASWTITFSSAVKTPGTHPAPVSRLAIDRPASITVVKTNRIYEEVTTMKSGQKTERWICNEIELTTLPGSDQVCYVAHGEMTTADAFDYSNSDFQGLEWLSLENYQGIKDYEGKPAFAFEPKPIHTVTSSAPGKSAMLTVKTQLPLYTVDEFGVARTYIYNPPPTASLVPPEKFAKVFKEFGINFK